MRKLLLISMLLCSFLTLAQLQSVKVVGVKDGDTVVVLDSLNNSYTVRLAEVDCPEKRQPYGYAAKEFTSAQVFNQQVKVDFGKKDKYGRFIGKIFYGEDYSKDLSKELVKNGMAWVYTQYSLSKELRKLQAKAKKSKVGLWADPNPVEPWKFRQPATKKK